MIQMIQHFFNIMEHIVIFINQSCVRPQIIFSILNLDALELKNLTEVELESLSKYGFKFEVKQFSDTMPNSILVESFDNKLYIIFEKFINKLNEIANCDILELLGEGRREEGIEAIKKILIYYIEYFRNDPLIVKEDMLKPDWFLIHPFGQENAYIYSFVILNLENVASNGYLINTLLTLISYFYEVDLPDDYKLYSLLPHVDAGGQFINCFKIIFQFIRDIVFDHLIGVDDADIQRKATFIWDLLSDYISKWVHHSKNTYMCRLHNLYCHKEQIRNQWKLLGNHLHPAWPNDRLFTLNNGWRHATCDCWLSAPYGQPRLTTYHCYGVFLCFLYDLRCTPGVIYSIMASEYFYWHTLFQPKINKILAHFNLIEEMMVIQGKFAFNMGDMRYYHMVHIMNYCPQLIACYSISLVTSVALSCWSADALTDIMPLTMGLAAVFSIGSYYLCTRLFLAASKGIFMNQYEGFTDAHHAYHGALADYIDNLTYIPFLAGTKNGFFLA